MRHRDTRSLVPTEERRPAGPWMVNSAMRRAAERAGLHGEIRDMHHIFRRSWAWRLIKNGVSLEYIKIAGGWRTLTVLLSYVEAIEAEEALAAIRDAVDD